MLVMSVLLSALSYVSTCAQTHRYRFNLMPLLHFRHLLLQVVVLLVVFLVLHQELLLHHLVNLQLLQTRKIGQKMSPTLAGLREQLPSGVDVMIRVLADELVGQSPYLGCCF